MSLPTNFFYNQVPLGSSLFSSDYIDTTLGIGLMTQPAMVNASFPDLTPSELSSIGNSGALFNSGQSGIQTYELGNEPVFPYVNAIYNNTAGQLLPSRYNDVSIVVNCLKQNADGSVTLGVPTYVRMSDLSTSFTGNHGSASGNGAVQTSGYFVIYPVKYRYNSNNSTKFGMFCHGQGKNASGTTQYFVYEAIFQVNTSTLEVSRVQHRTMIRSGDTSTNTGNPNIFQTSPNDNVEVFKQGLFAQGMHISPSRDGNYDKFGLAFGGLHTFYNTSGWKTRFAQCNIDAYGYGVLSAYHTGGDPRDPNLLVSNADGSDVHSFSAGYDFSSPLRRQLYDGFSTNGSRGSLPSNNDILTWSGSHQGVMQGIHNPHNAKSYILFKATDNQFILTVDGTTQPYTNFSDLNSQQSSGPWITSGSGVVGCNANTLYKSTLGNINTRTNSTLFTDGATTDEWHFKTRGSPPLYVLTRGLTHASVNASYTGSWASMRNVMGSPNMRNAIWSYVD